MLAITGPGGDDINAANGVQGVVKGVKRGSHGEEKEEEDNGCTSNKNCGFSVVRGRPDADMLKMQVPDIAERHVLMCGPEAFMGAMEELLKGLGVVSSAIHTEDFYF